MPQSWGTPSPSLASFSIPPHPCFLSQILKAQWHLPFLLPGSLWGFGATSTVFLSDFPDPPSSLLSPLSLSSCSFLPLPPTAASNSKHFFWPSKPPHLKLIWILDCVALSSTVLVTPASAQRFCRQASRQLSLRVQLARVPPTPFQLLYGVDVTAFPPASTDTPASALKAYASLSHHSVERVQSPVWENDNPCDLTSFSSPTDMGLVGIIRQLLSPDLAYDLARKQWWRPEECDQKLINKQNQTAQWTKGRESGRCRRQLNRVTFIFGNYSQRLAMTLGTGARGPVGSEQSKAKQLPS